MKHIFLFSLLLLSLFTTSLIAQETKVLFIGNSYTYVNDLPGMFDSVSTHLGKDVTVGSKTNGGYTFQNQYTDPLTFNAIHQNEWNLVVLQAQSQEPAFPTAQVNSNTLPYSNLLADSVYASHPCANVMYYMTWGRQNGDPQWDSINTFAKMNQRLYNAYMRFADSADAMVSPVAVAWKYVRDNHPTINLYTGDGSHPTLEGTYLVACTFYASVFQQTPVGTTYLAGLDPSTAAILQNAAAVSVLDHLELYGLHTVQNRTVADFECELDANGLFTGTSTSIHADEVHWYIDGEHLVANSISHQFTSPGTYSIQIIAASECNADTMVVSVNYNNASIQNNEHSNIKLYPNPSHSEITIEGIQGSEVGIYDINGRFLLKQFVQEGKLKLDVSTLKTGTYLLQVDSRFYKIQKL